MKKLILMIAIIFSTAAVFTSCREEKSGVEKAADDIEDAADDVGDEVEDATDDM
jgi:FlaG/FlaF family flagellin (archaellin)